MNRRSMSMIDQTDAQKLFDNLKVSCEEAIEYKLRGKTSEGMRKRKAFNPRVKSR